MPFSFLALSHNGLPVKNVIDLLVSNSFNGIYSHRSSCWNIRS